jgi:sulfate adenylyltransferase subunit 1 (EFTu-like GTPase family)
LRACRTPSTPGGSSTTPDLHDYRGYGGTIAGGVLKPDDEVVMLPSGLTTTIASIFDEYRRNRTTGSFILVDEVTNNTVGAGIILGPTEVS